MKRFIRHIPTTIFVFMILMMTTSLTATDWKKKDVDWRGAGNTRIKAIYYPQENVPLTLEKMKGKKVTLIPAEQSGSTWDTHQQKTDTQLSMPAKPAISAMVIDSPPTDGFVPYVNVSISNAASNDDDYLAEPVDSYAGIPYVSNPNQNHAIGIYDTGAGTHVISYDDSITLGLTGSRLKPDAFIDIEGVTGAVTAQISKPCGLFIDGLGANEPNGVLTNYQTMYGEKNVEVVVGLSDSSLITAIGIPMSVFFAAEFRNDQITTIVHNDEEYTAPDINFFLLENEAVPEYPYSLPLELRPLKAVQVQYQPGIDLLGIPIIQEIPSIILGESSQSLLFVHSVDLYEGQRSAIDKNSFMLDTGAQITVIGKRIAARLGINHNDPEFFVEVVGVDGTSSMAPGFYIDTIEIPALGYWITYTNVPVVLLDIPSPEGGTYDGIIGMNLFVNFNFLLRGGGMLFQPQPSLDFGFIEDPLWGDIAPSPKDKKVDFLDLAKLHGCWLSTPVSDDWDILCDIAPEGQPDGIVNLLDFALMSGNWLIDQSI